MPFKQIAGVDFRLFWGKARPTEGGANVMHPIAWHGLDVAAVFQAICHALPAQAMALASAFDGAANESLRVLSALVALHDVGKFARTFQAKVPSVFPRCLGPWSQPQPANHQEIGYRLVESDQHLASLIQSLIGVHNDPYRDFVFVPIFGHHGRPIDPCEQLNSHMGKATDPATLAARDFTSAVLDIFGQPKLPPLRRGAGPNLSWRLAGLVALADWLGSNQEHFKYTAPDLSPEEYWENCAKPRARVALDQSGLLPAAASCGCSMRIVGGANFVPTDAQRWAQNLLLNSGACLYFLEDVMGSGKTEAALILAHRLLQAGMADGIYVALPTMATANGLYRRLSTVYRKLFAEDACPSLVLSHGARDMNPIFQGSLNFGSLGRQEMDAYEGGALDETASAACTRWLADDRRKTFLAHVGVGTIDQALLAILPVKHACVRQIGLSRKVLIVDEAHAYDAYMQREIEGLIEHQARLGAPVIVLSATLPRIIRRRLAAAFAKGAGLRIPELESSFYPLATALSEGVTETPIAVREDLSRDIIITRCPEVEAVEKMVAAAVKSGAAVVYIRNTVDDACDTFKRLSEVGLDVELFHARFAMGDRFAIEERILDRFGKLGTQEQRRGRVLVATQVVEQSLDLDFDLMITDLAPIDLLIQRAGRLWRHQRKERGWSRPEFVVVSPNPMEDASKDWFSAVFPRAQWVYHNHALLWLSARELFCREKLSVPGDLRRLVESVYAEDALDKVPSALQRSGIDTIGKDIGHRAVANLNLLKLTEGYVPQSGQWGPDTVTPTRLGDERQLLRLARIRGGCLVPWIGGEDERRGWALSEVSVRRKQFAGCENLSAEVEALVTKLDNQWAEDGIHARAVPIMADEGVGQFRCLDSYGRSCRASYDAQMGLIWG